MDAERKGVEAHLKSCEAEQLLTQATELTQTAVESRAKEAEVRLPICLSRLQLHYVILSFFQAAACAIGASPDLSLHSCSCINHMYSLGSLRSSQVLFCLQRRHDSRRQLSFHYSISSLPNCKLVSANAAAGEGSRS